MTALSDKAKELAAKFDNQWGPFTKSLAGNPKTALAIGAGAGFVLGFLVAWIL